MGDYSDGAISTAEVQHVTLFRKHHVFDEQTCAEVYAAFRENAGGCHELESLVSKVRADNAIVEFGFWLFREVVAEASGGLVHWFFSPLSQHFGYVPLGISTRSAFATIPWFNVRISSELAVALPKATTSPFKDKTATKTPLFMPVSRDTMPGAMSDAPWQTASTAESLIHIFGVKARAVSMGCMNFFRIDSSFVSCH